MATERRYNCTTGQIENVSYTPGPDPVPYEIDRAQLRLALTDTQIDTVQTALAGLPAAARRRFTIEWQHRATIRRDSALAKAMGTALGLSDAQLDTLFIAGAAQ